MSSTVTPEPSAPVEPSAPRRNVRGRTALAVFSWLACAAMVAALVVTLSGARDSRSLADQASGLRSQLSTEQGSLAAAQQALAQVQDRLDAATHEQARLAGTLTRSDRRLASLARQIKELEAERAAAAAAAAAAATAAASSSGSTSVPRLPVSIPPPPKPTCTFVWDPSHRYYICVYK